MNRKILVVTLILLVLVLGSITAYLYIFKKEQGVNIEQGVSTNTSTNPEAFQYPFQYPQEDYYKIVSLVIDDEVLSPVLSKDKSKILYFSKPEGEFYSVGLTGANRQAITNENFQNVIDVLWSPNRENVILSFYSNNKLSKFLFNIKTRELKKFDEHIGNIDFSPDGSKIFYKYTDVERNIGNLNIADPDGTKRQKIKDLKAVDIDVKWLSSNLLAFYMIPSSIRTNSVYTLTPDGSKIKKIIEDGYGIKPLWSHNKKRVLFSEYTGRGMSLKILDEKGRIRDLDIGTFVEKCVWANDNKSVFCAVPSEMPSGTLPDDYLQGKVNTKDSIWVIDTDTGDKGLIASKIDTSEADVFDPFLSKDERSLYYVNRRDNKLYLVRL